MWINSRSAAGAFSQNCRVRSQTATLLPAFEKFSTWEVLFPGINLIRQMENLVAPHRRSLVPR